MIDFFASFGDAKNYHIDIYLCDRKSSIWGVKMVVECEKYVMIFKALADDTRLNILDLLSDGDLCARKILDHFDITQPTLSYHLKILTDCGLVSARREGAWIYYTLCKDKLRCIVKLVSSIERSDRETA